MDENSRIISDRLRDLRRSLGMTQETLAERADLSLAVIKKIESGGSARIQTYDRLARVLGVRTLWFEPETTDEAPHGDAGEAWAQRLVELRRARLWVEADVARELKKLRPDLPGVKSLTVMIRSDWESGRHRPGPLYRMLLAKVHDVDENELFGGTAGRDNGGTPESAALLGSHSFVNHDSSSKSIVSTRQLGNLSSTASLQIISGLRGILAGHIRADAMMGPLFLINSIQTHVPLVERACQITRGSDRAKALMFGSEFVEFYGWLHQDAGDFSCAMKWTNKALDYAMELDDPLITAYILMRKSNIATESGDPGHGLGLANTALANWDALTPRLRAVILRQRANAHALFKEPDSLTSFTRDSEKAIAEAVAGVEQQESDRAGYCTPAYVEMEAGASLVTLGKARDALPIFEASRSQWSDPGQARDNALCLARLATAYATANEPERACTVAKEAIIIANTIGSGRVVSQLSKLSNSLTRWSQDPGVAVLLKRLDTLVDMFRLPKQRR